jgi:archaellum component FlaF (FlaF/FlaG flagellin family)
MRRASWSETTAGTDSGATAAHAVETGRQFFVTSVSGHVDADATVKILDGSTVVWETKIDVSVEGTQIKPPSDLDIPITPSTACSAVISASTADCQVNISGYSIP